MMSPEALQILKDHDYVVEVRRCGDGCVVRFPRTKTVDPDGEVYRQAFAVRRGDGCGVTFNTTLDREPRFLEVPDHAVRPFVASAIAAGMAMFGLTSPDLVVYRDEEGEEVGTIAEILSGPEDRDRERALNDLLVEAAEDDFAPPWEGVAEQHGVLDGYLLCACVRTES